MADLRIFSYIPNPRLAKTMIAANFSGAKIEVVGDKPHGLLGSGPMGQSRVDGFLDRSLVFARDMQRYLLAGKKLTQEMHTEMRKSVISYATGLNTSLNYNAYLAGNEFTLADIAATCELSQLTNESGFQDRLDELDLSALSLELSSFQGLGDHIKKLAQEPIIRQELGNYLAKLVEVWP